MPPLGQTVPVALGQSWEQRFGAVLAASDGFGRSASSPALALPRGGRLRAARGSDRRTDAVMEDLGDYFDRLDAARPRRGFRPAASTATGAGTSAAALELPSVSRLEPEEIARLQRASAADGSDGAAPAHAGDCAICLQELAGEDELLVLPCAARHRFHAACLRDWLARSVFCPICRTDVKALLPPQRPLVQQLGPARRPTDRGRGAATAFSAASRTRDGGRVVRYEARPPPSWPRPAHIPSHLGHLAEYLEIHYPGRGTARIWRLPNNLAGSAGDLSLAVPV
eukprot:TRINITY_DN36005_c0_g1_i1.p1 TRINITY_DN36005_c0_g1~~TRINITY_DN36005_c0_g1_i1.p1  ORF type:complete len:309 (-),score=54.96 TRINITY_DN36005_c0_g1_i1:43-891(-)